MSASERDLEAAHLFHTFLSTSYTPERAAEAARGRDWPSTTLFMEAVRRGEDAVLAIPDIAELRESFSTLMSEDQARAQALESGWQLIDTYGDVESLTESGDDVEELSDESMQKLIEASLDWQPCDEGWRPVELDEGRGVTTRVWRRRKSKPRKVTVKEGEQIVELREIDPDLVKIFQRQGMSESAAVEAARGRD